MRFQAVVLVPRGTDDIQLAVARLMAPYDRDLPAPPWKKYLSEQAVKGHAARWHIPLSDLAALAARINEQLSLHLLADEQGIYAIAQSNPNGKYTRWSLQSLEGDVWPAAELPQDLAPHAVLTPDGQWHELFPTIWGRVPTAQDRQQMAREASALAGQYPDYLAVGLECHI